jgi:hypothetical protein
MADQKKKGAGQASTAKAGTAKKLVKLAEMPILTHAIESFIQDNTNSESSIPINDAIEDMSQCTDLMAVFTAPLQRQLLDLDGALHWILFLSQAPARAIADGDAAFPEPLPVADALALAVRVYDIGVQNAVWEHFEADDDDESDEDDAEDEEEAARA